MTLSVCGRDLAKWLDQWVRSSGRRHAKVTTVLGSIPASSDTVESEGRQLKKKKNRPKCEFLSLKSLWQLMVLIRPEIIYFARTFWIPAYSVVSFSATVERLKRAKAVYRRARGERRLEKTQTIAQSQPQKEYNCRYFILTFRKQKGEKIFGKNGFHTLQHCKPVWIYIVPN